MYELYLNMQTLLGCLAAYLPTLKVRSLNARYELLSQDPIKQEDIVTENLDGPAPEKYDDWIRSQTNDMLFSFSKMTHSVRAGPSRQHRLQYLSIR